MRRIPSDALPSSSNDYLQRMKRLAFFIIFLLLPWAVRAQGLKSEDNTATNLVEMRVGATFTKHFKDAHVNLYASEEIYSRLYESTYSSLSGNTETVAPYFRRSYTTVGVSYHPISYLRFGADYTLKVYGNKFTASDGSANPAGKFLRHRVALFVTGQYSVDDWKFSLREKLDMNIRTDSVNLNERPKTDLTLRHRLQAQYSIPGKPLKAYANIELWNTLNQPTAYLNTYAGIDTDGDATAYAGKRFGQYLSEVRTQIGLNWRVDKSNTLGIAYRFMYGYSRDVNITKTKANIELTHAKSYGHYIIVTYDLDW